jgi:hypothetical protein
MSIKTFIAEYKRSTKPLRVPAIYRDGARGHRLAPGGKAEVALRANKHSVTLAWISSAEGGQGYGSAALKWLCNLADRHKVTLGLKVDGERIFTGVLRMVNGTMETPDLQPTMLRAWYRRHGFVTVQRKRNHSLDQVQTTGFDQIMVREPETRPTCLTRYTRRCTIKMDVTRSESRDPEQVRDTQKGVLPSEHLGGSGVRLSSPARMRHSKASTI